MRIAWAMVSANTPSCCADLARLPASLPSSSFSWPSEAVYALLAPTGCELSAAARTAPNRFCSMHPKQLCRCLLSPPRMKYIWGG